MATEKAALPRYDIQWTRGGAESPCALLCPMEVAEELRTRIKARLLLVIPAGRLYVQAVEGKMATHKASWAVMLLRRQQLPPLQRSAVRELSEILTNFVFLGPWNMSLRWGATSWQLDTVRHQIGDMILDNCGLLQPDPGLLRRGLDTWDPALSWLGLLPACPSDMWLGLMDSLQPVMRRQVRDTLVLVILKGQQASWSVSQQLIRITLTRRRAIERARTAGVTPPRYKPLLVRHDTFKASFPPSQGVHNLAVQLLDTHGPPVRAKYGAQAKAIGIPEAERESVWAAYLALYLTGDRIARVSDLARIQASSERAVATQSEPQPPPTPVSHPSGKERKAAERFTWRARIERAGPARKRAAPCGAAALDTRGGKCTTPSPGPQATPQTRKRAHEHTEDTQKVSSRRLEAPGAEEDVQMLSHVPAMPYPALSMADTEISPAEELAPGHPVWAARTTPGPPDGLLLLRFPLSKEDDKLGREVSTLVTPCDVPVAAMPTNGRPLDARCLRPQGWLSTGVVDKLLEKFMSWADADKGKLALASSADGDALRSRLREEPHGPWATRAPSQRRLQGLITAHEVTLLPVCLEGHWVAAVFENRGTVGVVHLYNSIAQYGRSVLLRLARMATTHYAGAGAFPITWTIRHENCPQQTNGYDCGVVMLSVLMEIGGRYACGYNPPTEFQLPDTRHLRTRLAILLAEPLAAWAQRGGPRCFY